MLQFSPAVAGADEVGRVVLSEHGKGLVELVLLDVAMGGEVSAGGASSDQVFPVQQREGSGIVVIGEVHLGEPEGVRVAVCVASISKTTTPPRQQGRTLVKKTHWSRQAPCPLYKWQRHAGPCSERPAARSARTSPWLFTAGTRATRARRSHVFAARRHKASETVSLGRHLISKVASCVFSQVFAARDLVARAVQTAVAFSASFGCRRDAVRPWPVRSVCRLSPPASPSTPRYCTTGST